MWIKVDTYASKPGLNKSGSCELEGMQVLFAASALTSGSWFQHMPSSLSPYWPTVLLEVVICVAQAEQVSNLLFSRHRSGIAAISVRVDLQRPLCRFLDLKLMVVNSISWVEWSIYLIYGSRIFILEDTSRPDSRGSTGYAIRVRERGPSMFLFWTLLLSPTPPTKTSPMSTAVK
jgi:hypothetical protein